MYVSRCQGCKCLSHRGLFIFVCQTQISTHAWDDLLNKSILVDLWVNSHANYRVFFIQHSHGNIQRCQQILTSVASPASQSWQQRCCCCCWGHMDGLSTPHTPSKGFSWEFTAEQPQLLEALKSNIMSASASRLFFSANNNSAEHHLWRWKFV